MSRIWLYAVLYEREALRGSLEPPAKVGARTSSSTHLLTQGLMELLEKTSTAEYCLPSPDRARRKTSSVLDDQIISKSFKAAFQQYASSPSTVPLLLLGDAGKVLRDIPADSIDVVMTSPPYWSKREYDNGGIGLEDTVQEYVIALTSICLEIKRVLKPSGSFWLNIGDTYDGKSLAGVPWRIALELTDKHGFILRNDVIWNKLKGGMDNSRDRLGNVYEHVFHFVKNAKGYYYDADSIRSKPRAASVSNGAVVSATGVSGVRYRRQIELSTELTKNEKKAALTALDLILNDVADGKLSDFRMVIRGYQRVTHSDREKVSGRAKELRDKGYYFLKYHPKGSKPHDVWTILPEDTQRRKHHFASFPADLCRIPLLATCPPAGVVLDPFCGTGTTMAVARDLGVKSVGIDISPTYLSLSKLRCNQQEKAK